MSYRGDYLEYAGARDASGFGGLSANEIELERESRMAKVERTFPRKKKLAKKKGKADAPPVALELSLPTKKSTPSNRLQDYTILLFGQPKIGKTELTSLFPDTFHMMTEPGGKALSIYQKPVTSWREFLGYNRLLKKDTRFATASLDTVDNLYQQCFDHVTNKLGIEHPSEEAYGKGWKAIRDEFTRGMTQLLALPKGIILISHDVDKEVKQRNGIVYNRIVPTLSGQGRDIVEPMVDLMLYFHYVGDRRYLQLVGDEHISAGHRLGNNFRYPDGTAIKRIPMGTTSQQGFDNLMAAFHNKLPKPREEDETTAKKKKLSFKRKKK